MAYTGEVESGTTVFDEVIDRGEQYVYGIAINTTIKDGVQEVYGIASNTKIDYGCQKIYSGGRAYNTNTKKLTRYEHAYEYEYYMVQILNGGIAYNVNGSVQVESGGLLVSSVIDKNYRIILNEGASAIDLTVKDNELYLPSCDINGLNLSSVDLSVDCDATIINGKRLDRTDEYANFSIIDGVASNVVGSVYVGKDQKAYNTSGYINVYDGGIASKIIGSAYVDSGGSAYDVNGDLTVTSNGYVNGATVTNFSADASVTVINCKVGDKKISISNGIASNVIGELTVDEGQKAYNTSGNMYIYGGMAYNNYISSCTIYNGLISNTNFLKAATISVNNASAIKTNLTNKCVQNLSSSIASNTLISRGGIENIYAKSTSYSALINAGGSQNITSKGTADATIIKGGEQNISSAGKSINASISANGKQYVLSGGIAIGTKILKNGTQYVSKGAKVSNTTISTGGLQIIQDGATVSNTLINKGSQFIRAGASAKFTKISNGGIQYIEFGGKENAIMS